MNQQTQHRNKCQNCFRNVGKFILDCYCFYCFDCFSKLRSKNNTKCMVCFKPTTGKFIDTHDEQGMSKVNFLFGNYELSLSRCMDIYRFQSDLDLRYIRNLESQLIKYKELLNNIVAENPRLKEYVNNFFTKKSTPFKHKSVSENLQNRDQRYKYIDLVKDIRTKHWGVQVLPESKLATIKLSILNLWTWEGRRSIVPRWDATRCPISTTTRLWGAAGGPTAETLRMKSKTITKGENDVECIRNKYFE